MAVPWRGKRFGVLLTGVVGVLSVATGIASIAYGTVAVIGPLQPYVPAVVRTAAGFTGAMTGFLVVLCAFGLRRGFRASWYLALVLLPITAAQGLIQSSPLSLPLVASSILALPTLVVTRDRFAEPITLTATQIAAALSLAGVLAYGTVGAYALREEFAGLSSPLDAFYFTLVTASTVGYGDVQPVTQVARLFSLTVVVLGTAAFAVAIGALLGPVIEARLAAAVGRVRGRDLELLEDHVLVLGHGDLTEAVVDELEGRVPFALVARDAAEVGELADRGVLAVQGDPSEESTLDRVQVEAASVAVVATENDAEDAYAVLTARQANPELRIVAAATSAENVTKLERAGADVVLDPAAIGAALLVGSAEHVADAPTVDDREPADAAD